MNILVTGGAGYIGSHTARALQERGHGVIVYDNLSTGHEWAVKTGVDPKINCQLVIGDIADKPRLSKVFDENNIDAVIHFAASSLVGESVSNPAKYYENNVVGSKCLFDVMLEKGVKKLVFSSTCATYGLPEVVPITESEKQQPINTYGWTKFMIERIMQDYGKAYGLNSIALRYFNAAGASFEKGIGESHNPETHVIPLLLQVVMGTREKFSLFGEDYATTDGSCIRDYIHVEDLASAHILAVERLNSQQGFDYFNLGTGQAVSVLELIAAVEKITGKPVPTEICPRREGDPPVLVADNAKAVNELGWQPTHSNIEEIVYSAYQWALKNTK